MEPEPSSAILPVDTQMDGFVGHTTQKSCRGTDRGDTSTRTNQHPAPEMLLPQNGLRQEPNGSVMRSMEEGNTGKNE